MGSLLNAKMVDWLTKHGPWFVLCCVLLYFVGGTIANSLNSMAGSLDRIEDGQEKILYHTVRGSWRITEPPDEAPNVPTPSPNEP